MSKSELVYEFLGSRNINTTPIDITGLQGNTYDYKLVMFGDAVNAANEIRLTLNNDTTSNYRWYRMAARATLAFANVDDSISHVYLGNCKNKPTLLVCDITGELGDERLIKSFAALADSASATELAKVSGYWKDTITEVQSLQLFTSNSVSNNYHIMLYRVPKAANQGNWEKVDELTWAAESTEKSFTGLDGDRDKKYKIVVAMPSGTHVRPNNVSTATYTRQMLSNNNGTISAQNLTTQVSIFSDIEKSEFILNAKTGSTRINTFSSSQTSSLRQEEGAVWFPETVTNITTIGVQPYSTSSGTATLYRMKGNGETDGSLPWELIEEVDVSGDFSSGHVFDNLTGNSEKLFRVEFVGTCSNSIQYRLNSDATANQINQLLQGAGSSVAAGVSSTSTYQELIFNTTSTVCSGEALIYPRAGTARPSLAVGYSRENLIRIHSNWWPSTIDEINSILVLGSNSNTVTGKLKLWRLK